MFPIERTRTAEAPFVRASVEREREKRLAELMNKISSAEPFEGKSRNCEAIPDWGNDKTEG